MATAAPTCRELNGRSRPQVEQPAAPQPSTLAVGRSRTSAPSWTIHALATAPDHDTTRNCMLSWDNVGDRPGSTEVLTAGSHGNQAVTFETNPDETIAVSGGLAGTGRLEICRLFASFDNLGDFANKGPS